MRALFSIALLALGISSPLGAYFPKAAYADKTVVYLPPGYVMSQLSGLGSHAVLRSTAANSASANPAALGDFERFTFGASLQSESDIKPAWFADIGYRRPVNYPVQSLSMVLPIGPVRLGIGYFQKFSAERLTDPLEITDVLHPEGTGETIELYQHAVIDALVGMGAVGHRGLVSDNDRIDIGLAWYQNSLQYHEEALGYFDRSTSHAVGSSWGLGIRYCLGAKDSRGVRIGVSYEQGVKLRGKMQYDSQEISYPEEYAVGSTPDRLSNGLELRLNETWAASGGYIRIGWEEVHLNRSDQLDYYATLHYSADPSRPFMFGTYVTRPEYEQYFLKAETLRGIYFLAGLVQQVGLLRLDVVLADSHLFSGD